MTTHWRCCGRTPGLKQEDGKGEKGDMGMREVEARSSDLSDMLKQFGSICE